MMPPTIPVIIFALTGPSPKEALCRSIRDEAYKARENELREALMEECAAVTGARPDSLIEYAVSERGFLPGRDVMKYKTTGRFSGLVEDLGDDISVTLGRLAGHVEKLDGSEREKLLDAMLPTAFQNTHLITFKVPKGYKVDPNTHYSENKGNNGRENAIKILNISLL